MSGLRHKIISAGILILMIAVFASSSCSKVTNENHDPLRVSLGVWPGYAYAFIAKEKGFFEKNGVKVELILKKSALESRELFNGRKIDGIFDVFPDIILMNSEGFFCKVVFVADQSEGGDSIISGLNIKSIADLKGKKISVDAINSFSHMFALKVLEKAGLKETDVAFSVVPALDVLNAIESGKIDAGHTWEPAKSRALEKGYKILAEAGDYPGIVIDVLAFKSNVIAKRPKDIEAFVRSILEAEKFIASNRQEAVKIMAESEGMDKKEMENGLAGVRLLDLSDNLKVMKKTSGLLYESGAYIENFFITRGQISTLPSIDSIVESKFVNAIAEGR